MSKYYTLSGSLRGRCCHRHRTLSGAARCDVDDSLGCESQGGYSDRYLVVCEEGKDREPTHQELQDYERERMWILYKGNRY